MLTANAAPDPRRASQALRLLDRNADRMHFAADRAAWDRAGKRNGRIWSVIARLGIDDEVHAGLRERRVKGRPPAMRNWRKRELVLEEIS